MQPTEIRINRERTGLSITWNNGATSIYSVALLREKARDAASTRLAVDGGAIPTVPGLTIAGVEPVGNYGMRLVFSDGHDRGIFPWTYLVEIDETAASAKGDGSLNAAR